jgi:NAD+ diphosphatase
MGNDFNLCPICGSKKIQNVNNRKWDCPECHFKLYNNVAAAVGLIIQDSEGRVLFEKRVKEPKAGMLTVPGGFCDPDETAEDAARRECREEIGIEITDLKYLCSQPNIYEYKNITYKTCDMFFTAKAALSKDCNASQDLLSGLTAQKSEVQSFVLEKIESEEDVDKLPIAFISLQKTLKYWINNHE